VEDDVVDAADVGGAAELFVELARQCSDGRLAGLDLAAGEFPEQRHRLIGAALGEEDASITVAAERGNDELSGAGRVRHGSLLLGKISGILP